MDADVLDANMVVVLEELLTQSELAQVAALPESEDFSALVQPPLSYSQGLVLDPLRGGAIPSQNIESMRSQKTVSVSASRIEVHDRSGRLDPASDSVPATIHTVARILGVERLKAVGANFELTLKERADGSAAKDIAEGVLRADLDFLPAGTSLIGGGVRLFLAGEDKVTYTASIEPRFNDPATPLLFTAFNANVVISHMPEVQELSAIFQKGHRVLLDLMQALFPLQKPSTGKALLEALEESGFAGMWENRADIGDSAEFARDLRERAQKR